MPVLRDLGTAPCEEGIFENGLGSDHLEGRGDDSNTTRASYASSPPVRELSTTASGVTTSSLKAGLMSRGEDGAASPRENLYTVDDEARSNGSDASSPVAGELNRSDGCDKQDLSGAQSPQASPSLGASPAGAPGKTGQPAVAGEKGKKKKRGNSGRAASGVEGTEAASPLAASGSGSGPKAKCGDKSPVSPRQSGQAARSGGRRTVGASGSPAYFNGHKSRGALPHPPSPPSPGAVNVPPPPPLPLPYEMMHVPQLSFQPIPPPTPAPVVAPEPSELAAALEALFTQENLQRDRFLATKIKPGDLLLDVSVLLAHPTVSAWNISPEEIEAALERSALTLSERTVEAAKGEEEKDQAEGKKDEGETGDRGEKKTVKCIALGNLLAETRNTLVFRDVPESLSEEALRRVIESAPVFEKKKERGAAAEGEADEGKQAKEDKESPKQEDTDAAGPVRSIRREVNNTWFVVVEDENVAQELALWLRTQQIDDKPIRVGIKATHSLQRIVSSAQQYPTAALGSVSHPAFAPLAGVPVSARYGAHPLAGYPAGLPGAPPRRSGAAHSSLPLTSARFVPQFPPCTMPFNAGVFHAAPPAYGRTQPMPPSPANYAGSGVASRPPAYDAASRSPGLRPFASPGQAGKREKASSGKGGKGASSASAAAQTAARGEGKPSSRNSALPASPHPALRGPSPYMAPTPWIPFDLSWGSSTAPVPPPGWQAGTVPAGGLQVPGSAQPLMPGMAPEKDAGPDGGVSPSDATLSSLTGETATSSPPPPSTRNDGGERAGAAAGEEVKDGAGAAEHSGAPASSGEKPSEKKDDAADQSPSSPGSQAAAPALTNSPAAACPWVPTQPCYYDPVVLSSYNGGYLPTYDAANAATAYGCWAQGSALAGPGAAPPSGGESSSGVHGSGRGGSAWRASRGGGFGAAAGAAGSTAAGKPKETRWNAQPPSSRGQQSQAAAAAGGWTLVTGRKGKGVPIKEGDWSAASPATSGGDQEGQGRQSTSSRSHNNGTSFTSSVEHASLGSSRKSRGGAGSVSSSPHMSGAPFLGGGDFPSLTAAASARPAKPCGYKKAFRNFTAAEVVDICSNYEAACPNGIEIPQDIRDLPQTGCFLAVDTPRQGAACWTAFTARQRQKDVSSSADSAGHAGGSKNGGKCKKNAKQNAAGLATGKAEEGRPVDKKGEASKAPLKGEPTEKATNFAAKEKNEGNPSSEASGQGQDVFSLLRAHQKEAEGGQEKATNGVAERSETGHAASKHEEAVLL
ncbi:conserved hypothetical protein [Neospora caninum Liverpool]|uniref:Uncharacterized protein n=1 Tax=Neospora caninum (strain Liverpool) TaxID=572307 RepID=F0VEG9_NEOCL|nr:conserved hypothetical protein [Neospora caninum Liverpool]CBZ52113.1 conserved hypothetical protein [Neospora caninum Liverpool]CEL66075.1 TPA: hypothetical protein BN1204_019020 [Neospora caninum Liverpool]|eukprot:XP_003882145.1 conserved hypothetical protein [Neospora caninum Liverpool]